MPTKEMFAFGVEIKGYYFDNKCDMLMFPENGRL